MSYALRSSSGSLAMLKPFGPTLALRIGKIAVEGEAYFLHEGIDAEMKGLGRFAAFSDVIESAIELRHILDLNHQMKVPELGVPEAKFTACEAPTFDQSLRAQVVQVFRDALAKDDVAYALLQVAPRMINVHSSLCFFRSWDVSTKEACLHSLSVSSTLAAPAAWRCSSPRRG